MEYSFGKYLTYLCTENGIDLNRLSQLCGFSMDELRNLNSNKSKPTPSQIIKFAIIFNPPPQDVKNIFYAEGHFLEIGIFYASLISKKYIDSQNCFSLLNHKKSKIMVSPSHTTSSASTITLSAEIKDDVNSTAKSLKLINLGNNKSPSTDGAQVSIGHQYSLDDIDNSQTPDSPREIPVFRMRPNIKNDLDELLSDFIFFKDDDVESKFIQASKDSKPNNSQPLLDAFILNDLIGIGRYFEAIITGKELLKRLYDISESSYTKIHKGAIYYWIAVASFMVYDYKSAVFYFDAALAEDIKNAKDLKSTPSYKFICVKSKDPAQYAKKITGELESSINKKILVYNTLLIQNKVQYPNCSPTTLESIRNDFLDPSTKKGVENISTLATQFLSYSLESEKIYQEYSLIINMRSSELYFRHLFDGCVLFESLIKNYKDFSTKMPLPQKGFITISDILKKSDMMNALNLIPITEKLDANDFVFADLNKNDNQLRSLEHSVLVTARIRNLLGHNIGHFNTMKKEDFKSLQDHISIALIHIITCLYK